MSASWICNIVQGVLIPSPTASGTTGGAEGAPARGHHGVVGAEPRLHAGGIGGSVDILPAFDLRLRRLPAALSALGQFQHLVDCIPGRVVVGCIALLSVLDIGKVG